MKSWGWGLGLGLLLALAGCQTPSSDEPNASGKDGGSAPGIDDHDPDGPPPSEMPDSVVMIDPNNAGNVMGLVSGISGDRLEGAVVQLGGKTVMSGPDGVFELGELNAEQQAPIVVSLDGYAQGRTRVQVVKGSDNFVKITLAQAETKMLDDAQAGGVMQLASGVKLDLPANAIVDKNGNAVAGAVQVQIALLNDRDEIAAAPGNMMAEDPDGVASLGEVETPLESFGMAEVTLRDMNGEEVNLNGQARATLNIPMAANHAFKAGDSIPLWHYDEQANLWKNEGEGTLQDDNTFQINVNHFSWWNADQKLTKTCVIGRVLDAGGKPISAAQMSGEGRSYLGNSHAVTGEGGDFCMEARVGSVLDVSTTVQVGGKAQALAVRVNTPRTTGSCGEPTSCFMIDDLVAIADQPLCDPAQCPQQPGKVACCTTDLGPCDFIVNGDCGGNADGSWDPEPENAGVTEIPGVPMSAPPMMEPPPVDAGMSMDPPPPQDAGMTAVDAAVDAGVDSGTNTDTPDASTPTDAGMDGSVIDAGTDSGAGAGEGGTDANVPDANVPDADLPDGGNPSDASSGNDSGPIGDGGPDASLPDGGGSDEDGGQGGPGVDRCLDATVLPDLSPVEGTTAGSTLLNDWYDEGRCNDYLPAFERVYKVDVPAGALLRARALGPATFHTVIALDCGDVVGSCASAGASASFMNDNPFTMPMFVIVDAKEIDAQAPFTLYLSTAAPACGDGFLDGHEMCDDGNLDDLDGCSAGCETEEGWVCPPSTPCREIVCGDGIVDGPTGGAGGGGQQVLVRGDVLKDEIIIPMAGEQCDDDNTDDEDGCDSSCRVEQGYVCTGAPSTCTLRPQGDVCSDPLPLAAGDYDLAGFTRDYFMGQGPDMMFDAALPYGKLLRVKGTASFDGYVMFSRSQYCPSFDGMERAISAGAPFDFAYERTMMEEGGDGHVIVWFAAQNQAGSLPLSISSVTLATPSCGDGWITPSLQESCDDGNTSASDGCDGSCHLEAGYACPQPGTPCHAVVCNDGLTDWPSEDCEDGNTAGGDGCSSSCRTEPGYLCDWGQMQCELRGDGDLCNNADALPSGFFENEFSMSGMTPDMLDCMGCDTTRWFSFVQQPGEWTVAQIAATFSGHVDFFQTACPRSSSDPGGGILFGQFLSAGENANLQLQNPENAPARTVWMRVSSYSDPNGQFSMRMKTGPLGCGDGILNRYGDGYGSSQPQQPETCDDMNTASNDGCSSSCNVEAGWRCGYYDAGACAPIVCGDGVLDQPPSSLYEQCDDGNAIEGDGCSECRIDEGASCYGEPSSCGQTIPGDVCANALPLPKGESAYTIDAFTEDAFDPYGGSPGGQSAWFAITLQPRELLSLASTASFQGWVELYGSGAGGCPTRFYLTSTGLGSMQPLLVPNNGQSPLAVFAVVHSDYYAGVSGSFSLSANVTIPAMDCTMGECVPVVCGDGQIRGSEQCDDGDTEAGDGCSASCTLESTHVCNGEPSSCTPAMSGDSCENAAALVDGTYSWDGFLPEPSCQAVCGGASRWFTVQVPPWHTLRYHVSSNESWGSVRAFDVSTSCWTAMYYGGGYINDSFYEGQDARRTLVNASPVARTVALALWTDASESSASFSIDHAVSPIGCGDGNVDSGGQYGAPEQCDDGNLAGADGCNASCRVEANWDCAGGSCVPVVCGDGVINGQEQCDDENSDADDGCSPSCAVEPGWLCGGEPYACYRVSSGDTCSNAEPLIDGNYDLTGFLPDLPCKDVCQGPDRWMTVTVPANQTLAVEVSSPSLNGQLRWWDITDGGCNFLSGNGGGAYFSSNQAAHAVFVNYGQQPRTVALAVTDPYNNPSSGSYAISHTLAPIGCGDGYVDYGGYYATPEQCDDGNTGNGDGCSSSCAIDPGWVCGNNSPSQCVLPPPGDMCQSAQPLVNGEYTLSGYANECVAYCAPDRWFTANVAGGELLVVNVHTTSPSATAQLYELPGNSCNQRQGLQGSYFSQNGMAQLVWQAQGGATTFAVELADLYSDPSSASFTLDVHQGMPHCGDSFADVSGQYGAPEQCDDGNNFDNDGCSSTCMAEAP